MRLLVAVAALSLVVLAVPASARAAEGPVPTCSPGPTNCEGWYRTDVTVTWRWTGTPSECNFTTITWDTSGEKVRCSSITGGVKTTTEVTIKRDATPPQVTSALPERGPDADGWYNRPVSVSYSGSDATSGVASCSNATYGGGDGASVSVTGTCTDVAGNTSAALSFALKYDATPPQVTSAVPDRGPDADGWYNRPVSVSYSGSDATSGVARCGNVRYGGGDGASVSVTGTCTDVAGNTSAARSFALKYDATPPSVAAAPDRAPDARGWYRRPVTVSFTGADATSGVAACTEPTRYAGPDQPGVEVAGTCRDAAGNVAAELKLQLQYDATAPAVGPALARIDRGAARVTWKRPADATAIEIERTPGVNGRKSTIVYQGSGEVFVDRTVRNGARYRYEIRAVDAAGNIGSRAITTGPASPLHRPQAGETVRGVVTLAWSAVAGARFYNVQLYRGRKKVLSSWPLGASLRLARSWVYAGQRQRLQPGIYRWYVWPARGTRERPTYGRVLGSSTFRVRG